MPLTVGIEQIRQREAMIIRKHHDIVDLALRGQEELTNDAAERGKGGGNVRGVKTNLNP